ncbi:MAG: guanylate kinase [Elusimicrobia bacterium]|nr:guanylate kinase [Elusimicrobiota bacterium]
MKQKKIHAQGLIIVLSAPSGAGKTTLAHLLQKDARGVTFSVSCTTRSRRPGERSGRDYFFITEKQFTAMVARGGFAEWARVHDHCYGTPKAALQKAIAAGKDVILDIDVQGGLQVKKQFPGAVLIFVMPPTMKELERRLRGRGQDDEATIQRRLANARAEIKCMPRYDYRVINADITVARALVASIVAAEHAKIKKATKESVQ